jgi:hypothetical protein
MRALARCGGADRQHGERRRGVADPVRPCIRARECKSKTFAAVRFHIVPSAKAFFL